MRKFSDLPLLPEIQKSLDSLGFTEPTEIQAKIIPQLLEDSKRDVHAQAQTGTGKTLAFGIPLLQAIDPSAREVQALVVAPTRELVLQIYEALKEVSRGSGIAIEAIYGGMSISKQVEGIRRGAQIIIGTPGRLNDHLRRKTLFLKNIKVLVLDEADTMLDMGFKEEVDDILNYTPKNRNIWLFSATVRPGIRTLIKSHMNDVLTVKAAEKKGVVSSQVEQYYCLVPVRKRVDAISRFIEAAPDFYGIIFCQTKVLTSEVMEQLVSRGFRANCLHGDMKQALRNQVIRGFKNKDFNILIATDVAARGIDVTGLTHVINLGVPREHENYVHRIGRTGRAGKEGVAISIIPSSELRKVRTLERAVGTKLQEISVPPIEAILNVKMGAVSDFIEHSKQPQESDSPVKKALEEVVVSFTDEEVRRAFVASLQDKFFKDIKNENLGDVGSGGTGAPQEICIELGLDGGFSEDQMRDYLYNTCKLLPKEVGKVRVIKNKTFVSVPENRMEECLGLMEKSPIIKKPYKAYIVEDVYRERSGGSRGRGRSGGGRGRSGGGSGYRRGGSGGGRGGRSNSSSSRGGSFRGRGSKKR